MCGFRGVRCGSSRLSSQRLEGRSRTVIKFKASLVYTVNSRLVKVTEQQPVSKEKIVTKSMYSHGGSS
ncbi:hypothetical protein ACRRTK_007418 [Alexandromys fortis]